MRIVLVDGTVLDTADPVSCESFMRVGGGFGAWGRVAGLERRC